MFQAAYLYRYFKHFALCKNFRAATSKRKSSLFALLCKFTSDISFTCFTIFTRIRISLRLLALSRRKVIKKALPSFNWKENVSKCVFVIKTRQRDQVMKSNS